MKLPSRYQPETIVPKKHRGQTVDSSEMAKTAFRALAKTCHPDLGGSHETMQEINQSWEMYKSTSKTHVGFVLDNSGSMQDCKYSTIDSYNQLLKNQRQVKAGGTCSVSTFTQIGSAFPIRDAAELTRTNYKCRGGTPLYDTIGFTIQHIDESLGCPTDVVIIIITDGDENCSREFKVADLAQTIQEKLTIGWQFIYCSSDSYSRRAALALGIPTECITDYRDIGRLISHVSALLAQYRTGEIKQITFGG